MVFIFIILLGVVVYFYTINIRTLLDKQTEKPLYQYRKANTDPIEKSVTKKDFYGDAEFVNKNCTRLEDFIINHEINGYDLRKLADLNGIDLHIKPGWYPLTTALINELDKDGWDKTVSCIKEKYAELRFYANHQHNKILRKYAEKSMEICETCGQWGEQRYDADFIYVACRKHYLESRGRIFLEDSGFNYNGTSYLWNDIKNASFDNFFLNEYGVLIIEYTNTLVERKGWIDKKLRVKKYTIGFGLLLNHLPKSIKNLDYDYIEQFRKPQYCEICGYKAVYKGGCECCGCDNWLTDRTRWNRKESRSEQEEQEEKQEYLLNQQLIWAKDEGELYENRENNYEKNLDYKILYTEKELEEYLAIFESEDEDED
jgi:hypothetical protein